MTKFMRWVKRGFRRPTFEQWVRYELEDKFEQTQNDFQKHFITGEAGGHSADSCGICKLNREEEN